MKLLCTVLTCLVLPFSAPLARAEVPQRSPESLQQDASVIVTGKVVKIKTTDKKQDSGYVDTEFAIEVSVTKVLKGQAVSAGDQIVVQAWKAKERPQGWTGPGGQYEIPKEGAAVKIYLTGKKGGLTAISPNGLQALK